MRRNIDQSSNDSKPELRRQLRLRRNSLSTRTGTYYDRHLELLRHSDTPLRVGIAYSLQEIEPIEKNSWDIPLHGIVNEHGWFTFVG